MVEGKFQIYLVQIIGKYVCWSKFEDRQNSPPGSYYYLPGIGKFFIPLGRVFLNGMEIITLFEERMALFALNMFLFKEVHLSRMYKKKSFELSPVVNIFFHEYIFSFFDKF